MATDHELAAVRVRHPVHPVIFLEPVVHLMLGSVLLARSPFSNVGFGFAVGAGFVLLGVIWGIHAVSRYRAGAFSLTEDDLTVQGGAFARRCRAIRRADVLETTPVRGTRTLRFDPIHLTLARVIDYGSVEVSAVGGRTAVIDPVSPEGAATIIRRWKDQLPSVGPNQQSRAFLPAMAALLFVSFAAGAIGAGEGAHAAALPILLSGAGIFEVTFWVLLFSGRRRRTR